MALDSAQTMSEEIVTEAGAGRSRPALIGLAGRHAQRLALPALWAVIIVIFTFAEPGRFLTSGTISGILGPQAPLAILTLGLLVPLIGGDYDLSAGASFSLSAMVAASLNVTGHVNMVIAGLAGCGAGLGLGILNAVIVVVFNVDSFIATLGTGTLLQGIVLWVGNGQTINGVSQTWSRMMGIDSVANIPIPFFIALGLAIVMWYVLEKTIVGRRLLFVGRGREIARLNGIAVGRLRMGGLVVSGVLAALGGIVNLGVSGSAAPTVDATVLLSGFAAAYLGATTIRPGRFNPWGALIAIYFLVTGVTGLEILGMPLYISFIFYGGALILAVLAATVRIGRRRWRT